MKQAQKNGIGLDNIFVKEVWYKQEYILRT